jgi:crotonobetainyl-CoA:carnitine CoA-transferase CaiB-like acyl-CoA transferase
MELGTFLLMPFSYDGDFTVQAPAATLSRTPGGVRMPAPEAGEHTDAILAELGYSPGDIAALRRDAVV